MIGKAVAVCAIALFSTSSAQSKFFSSNLNGT
jgi:hypothetical protein